LTEYVDINEYAAMSRAAKVPYHTTLLVRDCCVCMHVQRAARALARRFDQVLRPLGLTSGQFSLLMSLNRPQPPTMSAVAALLAMDRTTLTAALKPLRQRRLLKVAVNPIDRRHRLLSLTPRGHGVLLRAVPVWRRTHAQVEGLIPDGDPDSLRTNLRALSSPLRRSPIIPPH
jgi:DNA-binding MarR family transcriptional regulator